MGCVLNTHTHTKKRDMMELLEVVGISLIVVVINHGCLHISTLFTIFTSNIYIFVHCLYSTKL